MTPLEYFEKIVKDNSLNNKLIKGLKIEVEKIESIENTKQ